jgi:hypothetical protein
VQKVDRAVRVYRFDNGGVPWRSESLLRPGAVILGHGYGELAELQYVARLQVGVLHYRAPHVKITPRACGTDIFDRIFCGIPTFA